MASICYSLSFPPIHKPPNSKIIRPFPTYLSNPCPSYVPTFRSFRTGATNSTSSTPVGEDAQKPNEASMSIDNIHSFFDLNLGKWNGSFFDMMMSQSGQSTKLKKPICSPLTNINSLQIGFFPKEKAFALRYQTAGMLETVLRQGVLGEDDTGEESPKNLKLPSRRPSIVCENCLYSVEKDMRARAFHIMDPKGIIEMLLIFLEERGDSVPCPPALDSTMLQGNTNRIIPYLGNWKGRSITKRSGAYGATIAEADTVSSLEVNDKGQLIQDITSTFAGGEVTTNVHWTGAQSENLVTFDGGYQMTLLPGGMYMGCPCDVAKCVAESKPFHLEFCWLETPGKRQRLVRTYDVEGLAVSSTYFSEIKL